MKPRLVRIFKYESVLLDPELGKPPGTRYSERRLEGTGKFHQWGLDYKEFENGAAGFSIGLVELGDGTVVKLAP